MLSQWWTFLEQRGEEEGWRGVGVPAVSGFLAWLRNGRTVERTLIARQENCWNPLPQSGWGVPGPW